MEINFTILDKLPMTEHKRKSLRLLPFFENRVKVLLQQVFKKQDETP